jgi:hypothetical protein
LATSFERAGRFTGGAIFGSRGSRYKRSEDERGPRYIFGVHSEIEHVPVPENSASHHPSNGGNSSPWQCVELPKKHPHAIAQGLLEVAARDLGLRSPFDYSFACSPFMRRGGRSGRAGNRHLRGSSRIHRSSYRLAICPQLLGCVIRVTDRCNRP